MSVEWFVCWISANESHLGYTFYHCLAVGFLVPFPTTHSRPFIPSSALNVPQMPLSFSYGYSSHHMYRHTCCENLLIALFFVLILIPGGNEEGLRPVYCLQCTGWKASIWRGISPALLNRAIQVSLFPIRLKFAIIFKRTQDGVLLKALKGFHFFSSTSFFFICVNRKLISYPDIYECSHISVNTVSKSNFFTIHDLAVGAVLRFAFWSTPPDPITLRFLDHWKAFCEIQKCVDIYLLSLYFNSLKWDYLLSVQVHLNKLECRGKVNLFQ